MYRLAAEEAERIAVNVFLIRKEILQRLSSVGNRSPQGDFVTGVQIKEFLLQNLIQIFRLVGLKAKPVAWTSFDDQRPYRQRNASSVFTWTVVTRLGNGVSITIDSFSSLHCRRFDRR